MKKVLSILLATVMLLGTVNFTAFASEENWVADTSWYNDSESSFTLDSAEKLAGLAQLVNGGTSFSGKTILLNADIDLENKAWEPIGSNTTPFQGKFEGGNHTISNLKVEGAYKYAGFFGYVKSASMTDLENPTIQNLTIEDAYIDTTEYNAAGALSGQIFVGTVKNVHATGTVKGGAKFAGGLVGHVYTSFDNCSFEGNVSSANQSGGIAGSGDGRVYNSYVKGDVNAAYWAGGIIGNGQEGTSIVNCYVEGDVSASNCWYYGVGGLAGVAGHGYTGAKIENNYFNGTVYLAGEKINTPVIGFVNANSNDTINSEVSGNSWNTDNYPADLEVIVTAEVEQSGTAAEYKDKAVAAEIQSRNNKLVMLESDLEHIDTINPEEVTIMTFSEVTEEAVEEAAEANVVAKIGDVGYATLEDAIKAAAPSGKVDIVSDITIEKWTMFAQDLTIGSGQIITLDMDGLTINGNGHSITVESIESASNGNRLFRNAENLNISDLTINIADGVAGGISLVSGNIDNVTFNGGNGVFPGVGEVTINECEFNTANHVIYYESARDNLTVTNNTFDVGADKNVILLRGNETFTNNNIISGRTVNAVSGSPTISGNTFAEGVRLKVYNDCTATISNNTLTYIVFEDDATTSNATFAGNILNDEAREALESVGLVGVAKIGNAEYCSLQDALTDAAAMNDAVTITLLDDVEWVTGAGHGSTPFVPAESSSVVTIDGNDFTITAKGDGVGSIRAANGTLLTFNNVNFVDESVSYNESAWEFTYLEFAGKLKFTNCDFKDEIQIDSDNNTSPITESEFTNCTFESNESSRYAVWFGNGSAKFDTCTFTGLRGLKMHEAYGSDINAIAIENCTFNNITEKPAIAIGDLNALTDVNIKNCTVNNAQAGDQNAYLLETDTPVNTFNFVAQNNTITVDGNAITPMVKIGVNEYPTIEEAIEAAVANDIIDIFNDETISDTDAATLAGKSVTINLNGKVLTINSATDYSDLISIPKNYKVNITAISDSAYTYSLKKVLGSSPVGVVSGSGTVSASEFTVTFNTNGGSKVSSAKVKKGEAAAAPANPEKEGYTFDGWYADKDLKTAFDFETKITKNITLYAKWADKTDTENETTDNSKNEIVLTIGDATINVFGNTIENDVAPKLVNDRTMLPARIIAESLGATVTWTAAEPNKVLIEKGETVIIITIGSDIATVNGEEIKLDSPAFIENDRTYIPTRFLSEKLGATVEWVPETLQVIITVTE